MLPANWKAVVDAFNEGYHVQGAHPQILPWTDDVSIAYEQFDTHARYGRLDDARRELRPSPRLGLHEGEFDEGEILAGLVTGLGGAFPGDERRIVEELRADCRGRAAPCLPAAADGAAGVAGVRRFGLHADQMTSGEDVYWVSNLVGPVYPGSAILFRVRPNGLDPYSGDQGHLGPGVAGTGSDWTMPERRFYPDWTAKEWDPITSQDYANLAQVQAGMRSAGFEGLRLNPRQEGNIALMHRVIDRYLAD